MKRKNIIIAAALTTLFAVYSLETGSTRMKIKTVPHRKDSLITVNLSFVGDLMCHSPQYQYASAGRDSFDFRPFFRYIKPFLSESDYTFGNLETVTSGAEDIYSGYPLFNSPSGYILALKDAGFDFLFTSNNHSMDRGERGVRRTIGHILNNSIGYTGTFSSSRDFDSLRIISVKGLRIAVLSYTYGVNGNYIPPDKKYLVKLIDQNRIRIDLLNARTENPDIILVYYHFGEEYSLEPNRFQKQMVQFAVENGADIIIGSHPHVLQPVKLFSGKRKLNQVPVAFSLGNFFSNQTGRYRDSGTILTLAIRKNVETDSVWLNDISFTPTWVFKGSTGSKREFLILPSEYYLTGNNEHFLTPSIKNKMKESLEDSKRILQRENAPISFRTAGLNL